MLAFRADRGITRPNGALHDVVQWVHRSSFTIRRPGNAPAPSHLQETYPHLIPRPQRAPVPSAPGFLVDPNWYGRVVIEAEGTNEGLVDLQERCGPGVFPPRAETIAKQIRNAKENAQARKMWRVVRERRSVPFYLTFAARVLIEIVVGLAKSS